MVQKRQESGLGGASHPGSTPHAGLAPVSRASVVDHAFAALRARILNGTFAPGSPLPTEAALTKALGVSRSTVREALNRLASARLIHIQHSGPKTVLDYRIHAGLEVVPALISDPNVPVDPNLVRAITEMRSVLAPDAARLAARRRTTHQAEQVLAAAEAVDPKGDLDALAHESIAFWMLVVGASQNLAYQLAFNSLRVTYVATAGPFRQLIATELRAREHYLEVAHAISAGDEARAEAAARTLVRLGDDMILAALDTFETQSTGNLP